MSISESRLKESNEYMDSFILEYLNNSEKITKQTIEDLSVIEFIEEKLKRNGKKYKYPTNESASKIGQLIKVYLDIAFTESEDIKTFFISKLGLKKNENWFTPISQIKNEIDKINKSDNFRIDPNNTIIDIYNFTLQKITSVFIKKYSSHVNGEPVNLNRLKNHFKTKKLRIARSKKIVQSQEDASAESIINIMKVIANQQVLDKGDLKNITSFIQGNIESLYIPTIYNESLVSLGDFEEGEKQLIIYDLLALFMKDRPLWNEFEFHEHNRIRNRSYKNYQKKAIRNILGLK